MLGDIVPYPIHHYCHEYKKENRNNLLYITTFGRCVCVFKYLVKPYFAIKLVGYFP